jgi:hypothetical protein
MKFFNFLFKKKNQEKRKKKLLEELNLFIEQIKAKKVIEPIKTEILLKEGEKAFLKEDTTLLETKAVRYHKTKAIGVRILPSIYIGFAPGRSESKEEWRIVDRGVIILTNQRLIFDGSKEDRVIPLNKIISIKPFLDSIEISTENRKKSMLFNVNNPLIWATLIQILVKCGDLEKIEDLKFDIENYKKIYNQK